MKKVLRSVIVLLALATVAFVVFKKTIGSHVPAAQLLPAETLLFVDLPNLPRTAVRWPQTGLAKIFMEPELQKFLEKPRSAGGPGKMLDEKLTQILRLAPREVFFAVTSIDGPSPSDPQAVSTATTASIPTTIASRIVLMDPCWWIGPTAARTAAGVPRGPGPVRRARVVGDG